MSPESFGGGDNKNMDTERPDFITLMAWKVENLRNELGSEEGPLSSRRAIEWSSQPLGEELLWAFFILS